MSSGHSCNFDSDCNSGYYCDTACSNPGGYGCPTVCIPRSCSPSATCPGVLQCCQGNCVLPGHIACGGERLEGNSGGNKGGVSVGTIILWIFAILLILYFLRLFFGWGRDVRARRGVGSGFRLNWND